MPYYIDTHDQVNGTFPAGITPEALAGFFATFEQACKDEGVSIVRAFVNLELGRSYCLTEAPDADAVGRARATVGLPYDQITEVQTIGTTDLYLPR